MSTRFGWPMPRRAAAAVLLLFLLTAATKSEDFAKLEIVPAQLTLEPGASDQDIVVVAHATAEVNWEKARLSLLPGPGVKVAVKVAPTLPSTSDIAWTVHVSATERSAKDTTIAFWVDFQAEPVAAATAPQPVRNLHEGVIAAAVKVGYTPLQLSQAIKASIQHGFESLKPNVGEDAVLTVENTGIDDVALEEMKSLWPDFITAESSGPLPAVIPGRSSRNLPIKLTAGDRVPQGKVALLLQLQFARGAGTERQSAPVIITDNVSIGIPGLADVKTVFQLPSLFILPGLLVVLTWGLLWRVTTPPPAQGASEPAFPPSYKNEAFYLCAVTLSFVICYGYAWYNKLPFDFLDRVSIRDITIIWLGSILVVAPATYFGGRWLWKGAGWIVKKLKDWHFSRNNPMAGDEAVVIIEKLDRKKQNFRLTAYTVNNHQVFRLPFGAAQNDNVWVVPPMLLSILPAGANQLAVRIDNLIATGDTAGLHNLMKQYPTRLRIEWATTGAVPTTSELPTANLGEPQGAQSLVQRN
jgi:hypothetical protein